MLGGLWEWVKSQIRNVVSVTDVDYRDIDMIVSDGISRYDSADFLICCHIAIQFDCFL